MIKPLLCLASLSLTATAGLQAASLPDHVDDRAAFFAYVPDVPKLRKNYQQSPFARTWADEQVKRYFAPLLAKWDLEKWDAEQKAKTGMSLDELLELINGEALLTVHADERGEASPIFIIEVSDDAKATKLAQVLQEESAKQWEKKDEENAAAEAEAAGELGEGEEAVSQPRPSYVQETSKVAGAQLHSTFSVTEGEEGSAREETSCWAVTKGKYIIGRNQASVGRAVVALNGSEPDASLGRSERFLRSRDRLKGEGLVLGIDFNVLIPWIQESWKKSLADQPPNPMLNPDAVFNALGLSKLDAMTLAMSVGDQSIDSYFGLTYHANEGLIKMLALTDGPLPKPNFVPERWASVSSIRFSLPAMYTALEEVIQAYNPAWHAMGTAMITGTMQKFGVDLKRDILAPMGDEMIAANALRPGKDAASATAMDLDNFYSVSLKDPKVTAGALSNLAAALDPQKQGVVANREFMGNTIYSMTTGAQGQPGASNTIAFGVVGNQLMFATGSTGTIEAAIRTGKGGEKTWWDRADVKRALEEVPAKAASFSFQDNAALISMVFATLDSASAAAEKQENGEPFVDSSARPDINTVSKYWGTSSGYSWRDANGIHAVSTLPYVD